jgi:hypothetical protein
MKPVDMAWHSWKLSDIQLKHVHIILIPLNHMIIDSLRVSITQSQRSYFWKNKNKKIHRVLLNCIDLSKRFHFNWNLVIHHVRGCMAMGPDWLQEGFPPIPPYLAITLPLVPQQAAD